MALTRRALLTGVVTRASVASGTIQTSFLEISGPAGGGTSVSSHVPCGILVLAGASSVTPVGPWGGESFVSWWC